MGKKIYVKFPRTPVYAYVLLRWGSMPGQTTIRMEGRPVVWGTYLSLQAGKRALRKAQVAATATRGLASWAFYRSVRYEQPFEGGAGYSLRYAHE